MKTIIEILQEEKIDLNIVNNYRYDTLSSKEAKIIVDTLYSVLQCTVEELKEKKDIVDEQKQLLVEADSKVIALEAYIDSQVKVIDNQREEIRVFKNAIDDYNKRTEETIEILKDKNAAIDSLNSTILALQGKLTNTECDLESAEDKISTRDSAIEVIDEENKKLQEELIDAKKACDTCPLIKLDTKYDMLNQAYNELDSENYALKQAYESKDTQVGDLIQILSKLVND